MQGVEQAQDCQQGQQERGDAGDSDEVEGAGPDGCKGSEAANGGGRDQKAGDGEEDLHALLAAPDERRGEGRREAPGVRHMREEQAHVHVVHKDVEDGQGTEAIDAVEPGLGCGVLGWLVLA
jgi:hypothetical protein